MLAAVGADPPTRPAAPAGHGRADVVAGPISRSGWPTGGTCSCWPPATWPARSASTRSARRWPTSPTARWPPGSRSPWPGCGRRRRRPAGGDRDGQVRRPRAQLRLRRRRGLRRRAGTSTDWRPAPPGQRHPWPRPSCGSAARWPGRSTRRCGRRASSARWSAPGQPPAYYRAGPGPGSSRRCSRPGRWPATSPSGRDTSRRWRRWCGRRPSGPTSSPTCRRCAGGSRTPCRRRRPTGRSSSAAAGCATSSSPSSCCSWCTAGRTSRCASAARSRRCEALSAGGYVGRDDARDAHRVVPLAAVGRAPAAAAAAAPHPPGAGRPTAALRWLARAMGFRPDARGDAVAVFARGVGAARPRGTPAAREAVLPAAAARGGPGAGRPAAADPRAAARRLEALGFADPDGALRHLSALTAGVSRRAAIQRTLLPVVLHELRRRAGPGRRAAGVPAGLRRARRHALVPAVAAGRGPGHRAAGPAARHQPVRGRAAHPGPGGAAAARRRRRAASRGRPTALRTAFRRRGRPRHGDPAAAVGAAARRCAGRSCCGSPRRRARAARRPRSARR